MNLRTILGKITMFSKVLSVILVAEGERKAVSERPMLQILLEHEKSKAVRTLGFTRTMVSWNLQAVSCLNDSHHAFVVNKEV